MYYLKNRNQDLFKDNLFDEFFNFPIFNTDKLMMRTDVKKENDKYIFEIEVPGFNKEDIKISLNEGYLTVEAKREVKNEQQDENKNYIKRERYYGQTSRKFYVGNITENDIEANYTNGVLTINVLDYETIKNANKKFININ